MYGVQCNRKRHAAQSNEREEFEENWQAVCTVKRCKERGWRACQSLAAPTVARTGMATRCSNTPAEPRQANCPRRGGWPEQARRGVQGRLELNRCRAQNTGLRIQASSQR